MTALAFRCRGALEALTDADRGALFDRSTSSDREIRDRTSEMIARVRRDGDRALRELARELDGVSLATFRVSLADCRRALAELDPELRGAMERAARNITAVHRAFRPESRELEVEPGVTVGRRPDPLGAVGIYAPGGRAAYPSSVLMGVIPAKVAGVPRVVLCSPPDASGRPALAVLAAAALAEVDEVYAVGGAGAIAALAYGTESIAPVDRIVGPGNAYVAEAKLQVTGQVAIDSPAGPSELLLLADAEADDEAIAREVIAQAEHDPRAAVVVITVDAHSAEHIEAAVARTVQCAPRRDVITAALANQGALLWTSRLDAAVEFANRYAAEHVVLALGDPTTVLARIRNAGTVFLGQSSSNVFGDYMTGANHVLPTGGLARAYSGLSTLDFVRWTTYQRVDPDAAARLAEDVARFAEAERLPGHAAAARALARGSENARDAWSDRIDAPREPAPAPARWSTRASYREISLYTPDRRPCAVDLSDNTNLWGVPPAASRSLRETPTAAVTRYPSTYARELKEALAGYAGVAPSEVVTACGSDDVLDAAFRALAEPGDQVAFSDPTFAMVPLFARMNGLEPVSVPLTSALEPDVDALVATGAPLIYLCSPNNPTGQAASRSLIEQLVSRAPGLVILDEAYAEFMGGGMIGDAPRVEGLLVTRTMSKAFGLAGLRIGYAAGAAALVTEVEKARGPYKVSVAAERAALAALREDMDWVGAQIAEVRTLRDRFTQSLRDAGFAPLASSANFLLVPVDDAAGVAAGMRARGVAVRPFPALTRIGDAIRITIAPWPMLQRALDALTEARACA